MMDRADRCRRAARDAVADVEPASLQTVIDDTLAATSMTPGVLTLDSAATVDPDVDVEAIATHAAGVQLIYDGLRLTRSLAHDEPWTRADTNGDGDLEILAADILVARGFYLLARTDAAGKAVRTVRAFGRDQTLRREPDADTRTLDGNLERDVLELAVMAGAAAVGEQPTPDLVALANDVADAAGHPLPPADECLPGENEHDVESRPHESTTTDRATSATDP